MLNIYGRFPEKKLELNGDKIKYTVRGTSPLGTGLVIPLAEKACFIQEEMPYVMEPGMVVHAGSNMSLDKEVIGNETGASWRFSIGIVGTHEVWHIAYTSFIISLSIFTIFYVVMSYITKRVEGL